MTTLTHAAAMLACLVVLMGFVRAERRERPATAVGVLIGVILIEAVLYQSEHLVPEGLFRPSFVGQSFRMPEITIGLALAGKMIAHGLPRRVTAVGGAWSLFIGWYAVQALLGIMLGNPISDVLFQARAVVYVGGAYALVRSIPVDRLLSAWFFARAAYLTGAIALVFIPLSLSESSYSINIPGVPLPALGRIGADSASIFVVAAIVIGLVELSRAAPRRSVMLAIVPLTLAPFATTQRGAVVGLGASVAVLMVAACARTWHRRGLVTGTQLGLGGLCLIAVAVASFLPRGGAVESTPPLTAFYEETFEATGKQQSADTRLLLWDEAHRLWMEQPLLGSGLGKQFEIQTVGTRENWVAGGFHNLAYDLLVRSGVVGLVLFTVAIALSIREGLRGWTDHPDPRVAALALAAVAAAAGLLSKGLVESVLEKAKLSTLLGVLFAVMVSAGREAANRVPEIDVDGARVNSVKRRRT